MHYVQVVSGPFACRVEFEGRLADNPTILGAAPVWHRFVGQPVENLLSWLVGKHGGLTVHNLDGTFTINVPARGRNEV